MVQGFLLPLPDLFSVGAYNKISVAGRGLSPAVIGRLVKISALFPLVRCFATYFLLFPSLDYVANAGMKH